MIRLINKAASLKLKCNLNSLATRCMSAAPSSGLPSPQTNPEILYTGVCLTKTVCHALPSTLMHMIVYEIICFYRCLLTMSGTILCLVKHFQFITLPLVKQLQIYKLLKR